MSAGRTALGVLALAPFAWRDRRAFPRQRRVWLGLTALGLLNFAFPWTLFSVAQQSVPSGVGAVTNAVQPLWAAILAAALLAEGRIGVRQAAGLALGFGGVLVLMQDDLGNVRGDEAGAVPQMVLATLCYVLSGAAIRRWLRDFPALPLTSWQVGTAALALGLLALATGAYDDAVMGWGEWGSLLALGLAGSGFVVLLFMRLIQQAGPVRAALVTYLMPPVGLFLGWLLLDEAIGWELIVGLGLIVPGIVAVQGLPRAGAARSPSLSPGPTAASAPDSPPA